MVNTTSNDSRDDGQSGKENINIAYAHVIFLFTYEYQRNLTA